MQLINLLSADICKLISLGFVHSFFLLTSHATVFFFNLTFLFLKKYSFFFMISYMHISSLIIFPPTLFSHVAFPLPLNPFIFCIFNAFGWGGGGVTALRLQA